MIAISRILRHLCIAIGLLLVAVGVAAAAYGVVRMSFLVETTGLVTEGTPLAHASSSSRAIFYRYTVDGTTYSGMSIRWLEDLQDASGRSSRTIRVFYKRGNPAISYAVYRPSLLQWLRFSAFFPMVGIVMIVLSRKIQLSNRTMEPIAKEMAHRICTRVLAVAFALCVVCLLMAVGARASVSAEIFPRQLTAIPWLLISVIFAAISVTLAVLRCYETRARDI